MPYAILFFIFFLGHGSYFSSLSPYMLTHFGAEASLIFMVGQICFPVGYFAAGFLSDRFHHLRLFLVLGLLLMGPVQFLLFSFPDAFWPTMVLSGFARFCFAINLQLITVAALEGVGDSRYGRVRSAGTVSFLLIHLILFLVESGAVSSSPLANFFSESGSSGRTGAVFPFFAAFAALLVQKMRKSHVQYYFWDALRIIYRKETLFFFFLSFLYYFSFQLIDYYLGHFLKEEGGMRLVYLGWCLAVLLEIVFLPFTGRLIKSAPLRLLFILATLAGTLRFGWLSLHLMGVAPLPILYSQLLHGIQFTGFYMGSIFWLRSTFPEHLFGTGIGAYVVLTAFLGGMSGNLLYSKVLFHGTKTGELAFLLEFPGDAGPYLPVFFSAMIIQAALFFCFIFFPTQVRRYGE